MKVHSALAWDLVFGALFYTGVTECMPTTYSIREWRGRNIVYLTWYLTGKHPGFMEDSVCVSNNNNPASCAKLMADTTHFFIFHLI